MTVCSPEGPRSCKPMPPCGDMHAHRFGFEQDLDAILLQHFANFGGNVRVLPRQELFALLHHRDGAAEAAKHLAEFQTDVAAPQNQQMFRHRLAAP